MHIQSKDSRISSEEIEVLRAMFQDREGAVEVIRKIFYPELTADNPIMLNRDMYTTLQINELSPEQALLAVTARQQLVKHIEESFQVIKQLIGEKGETAEQTLARLQKNSAK